jgi:hypothetical protein
VSAAPAQGVAPSPAATAEPPPAETPTAPPTGTATEQTAEPAAVPTAERLRIEIHPTALTWIEASADGASALYELLDAGQRRTLEADREIALRVGDAAAFAYSINGMPGRVLGGPGEVRAIQITPANYKEFVIAD